MYNKKDLINLTDRMWQNYKNVFEQSDRKRKHSLKKILHAVLYVDKTGCQWRMLPESFPK
jgi:putative transposase